MAKFCGNCGAQMEDTAKICGNCGTPFQGTTVTNVKGIGEVDPQKQAKNKKIVKLAAAAIALILVLVIGINTVSKFTGYQGVTRKAMNALEAYDVNALVSMASGYYDEMDDLADEYFKQCLTQQLNTFEDRVGHDYSFDWEISESYTLSKHNLEQELDTLDSLSDFDVDTITEIRKVTLQVEVDGDDDEYSTKIYLTLTKEKGDWKILYLY